MNVGQRVRIIEPGPTFGQTGTVIEPIIDPETIPEFWDTTLPIRLDDSDEIVYCYEPWGMFDSVLQKLGE